MVDTLKAGSASVELENDIALVRLQDITFDIDLWKPLYPSLFDYGAVPSGLNIVPSFQVRDSAVGAVEITLELEQDQSFELQSDLPVFWRMIQGNLNSVTSSSVTLKSCVLHINLQELGSTVGVLQVLCRKTGQTTFSGTEEIEGGLFLVIVNEPAQAIQPNLDRATTFPPGLIHVTEIDSHGRVHYNIFHQTVYVENSPIVSAGLEPEPAFRIQQGTPLSVGIALRPENLLFVPVPDHPLEAHLDMVEPPTQPSALSAGFESDAPTPQVCTIDWTSPNDAERLNYFVASFSIEVHELTPEALDFLKKEKWDKRLDLELLNLLASLIELRQKLKPIGTADPTVIDTPKCTTINGQTVCSE